MGCLVAKEKKLKEVMVIPTVTVQLVLYLARHNRLDSVEELSGNTLGLVRNQYLHVSGWCGYQ